MSKRSRMFVHRSAVAVWLLLFAVDVPAQVASVSTVPARIFPDGPVVEGGTSTLVRNDSGVTATMKTSQLEPGAAYTLWWVVFNHPENCSPPRCSLDDVAPFPGNEAAGTSLVYASGHLVGSSGKSDFAGDLKLGDPTGVMFGPGLSDPVGAAVHLVLRNHGQPIPGEVDSQIGTFEGGCDTNTCSRADGDSRAVSRSDGASINCDQGTAGSRGAAAFDRSLRTGEGVSENVVGVEWPGRRRGLTPDLWVLGLPGRAPPCGSS